MLLTFYSLVMAVLWSSIFVLIISVLRRNYYFIDISSVYGMVLLYLFCVARMFIPVEFSWTRVIQLPNIYNKFFLFFNRELFYIGSYHICIYHLFYIIWITGAVIILINVFYKYYKCSNAIKSLPVNTENTDINNILRQIIENKPKKNVEVVISPAINEPVSFGIIHRKILIPDYPYSQKELYYIVTHEFIHLKNHDLLVQMLVNILCAVYWWNPFVYFLRNGLEKSFEFRCDQVVTQDLDQKETADYLETILKVFKNQNSPQYGRHNKARLLGTAEDNVHEIKERFALISRIHKNKTRPYGKWTVTGIMMFLIVLSYSFILQTAFHPSEEQIETSGSEYKLSISNSYIVKYADGVYTLKTDGGDEFVVDKETADKFVHENGFKIIEEESNYEEN